MSIDSDRDFRGYNRYSGDGLSPAVLGNLPIGQPGTGVFNITKESLRRRFDSVDEAIANMEAMRDYIEGIIGDAVSSSNVPIFQTVASAQAVAGGIPIGMNVIRITGKSTAGVGGAYFKRVGSTKVTGSFQDAASVWWEPTRDPGSLLALASTTTIDVGVGTTGDFADLTTAVDRLLPYAATNAEIKLHIVSPLTSGLLCMRGDFSRFTIVSDIGVVPLDAGFTGPSDSAWPADNISNNLILGYYADLPTLGCVIDMGNKGGHGYYGVYECRGSVQVDCGVINAGQMGLVARTSHFNAYHTNWSGATQAGIRAAHGAMIGAQQANASNCCKNSTPENGAENQGAVDVSRMSFVHFREGNASGSGARAINVRRDSIVCFQEANCSGAAFSSVYFHDASFGSGYGANITGATGAAGGSGLGRGLTVESGSVVDVRGAAISGNSVRDIEIADGGVVIASGVTTTHSSGTPVKPQLADTNAFSFNAYSNRGLIISDRGPLFNWGEYSPTGSTNGKDINENTILVSSRNFTSSLQHFAFANTNGPVGSINTAANGTQFLTTSDGALKTNRTPLASEINIADLLDRLAAGLVAFDWLRAMDLQPAGDRGHGLIAQDVAAILPMLVSPRVGEPGAEGWVPAQVDYSKLAIYLLGGWAKLRADNAALAARIAALEI